MTKVLAIVGAGPGLGASIAKRFAAGGWAVSSRIVDTRMGSRRRAATTRNTR